MAEISFSQDIAICLMIPIFGVFEMQMIKTKYAHLSFQNFAILLMVKINVNLLAVYSGLHGREFFLSNISTDD